MKKKLIMLLRYIARTLAALFIRKFKPFVIAVTGSVGKTSAKEAIYAAVCEHKRARKSSANFNNELGVPLTILGDWQSIEAPAWWFWIKVVMISAWRLVVGIKEGYPEIIVLEYGADKPGDISKLFRIAQPDISVVSAIGLIPVHVENYPTGIEAVVKEKGKMVTLLPASKTAFINSDDPYFKSLSERARAEIISYGFSELADMRIVGFSNITQDDRIQGISFKIQDKGSLIPFSIKGVFSIAHTYAVACAMAVAKTLGINVVDAAASIEKNYKPVYGRSVIINGIKGSQIIDESYNSSPLAVETALKTMKNVSGMRKIAVLGDMLELGHFTTEAHELIGKQVPYAIDILLTVGARARIIAHKAIAAGMKEKNVYMFEEAPEAGFKLQSLIKPGDLILIKGSRSIGLDKVVEEVREMGSSV